MPDSGGTSTAQQTTQQSSKTQPWKPTIPHLENIIGAVGGQFPNYQPTSNETGAIDQLLKNAQAGNQFAPQFNSLATDLLGGGTDRTGVVNDAYSSYQKQAQPYLDPSYLDPASNPHFQAYTNKLADSAASRVNQQFAASGRDMSGAHMKTLGQGITDATLPVFANQYNQNVATQRGMMDSMFGAGTQTAGLLSGMDQTSLGNRMQGIGAAGAALEGQNYGANATLAAEAQRRGLPLGNLGALSSLLLPIAGLGGQSSGTATSNSSQTMSPAQQFMMWSQGAKNIGSMFAPTPKPGP